MDKVPLDNAVGAFDALVKRVEAGETIVVTRDGRPILDLVPHRPRSKGFDAEAAEAYLQAAGVVRTASFIADDFDDPLSEDFLIRPLPEP